MKLSARRLNRATLARQLLLERQPLPVAEAVRRVVAVQAQEPASPYLALWNRVTDLDPAAVDEAFASHAIVKGTLIRITLHAVAAEDFPAFHHAMVSSRRAARLTDRRFVETGATIAEADGLLPEVLAFLASPRTNAEVDAWITERLGRPSERMWWALRTFAPVLHAATGGPWSFGPRPTYLAAPGEVPAGDPGESERWLIRRYLEGFGPATAQDVGLFTILRMPVVGPALERLAADGVVVRHEGPGGEVLHDVVDGLLPDEDGPAPPRLMAMWDSSLLAYADRARIIPEPYRAVVIRRNGDTLPTVLVDGRVAGVWRPAPGGGGIEVTAFEKLPKAAWSAVADEAAGLAAFLAERDPEVYRRYWRWWDAIDAHNGLVVQRKRCG